MSLEQNEKQGKLIRQEVRVVLGNGSQGVKQVTVKMLTCSPREIRNDCRVLSKRV